MNRISKFFHEIFNPHCEHCREEYLEAKNCKSCDSLKYQVERLIYENNKLIDSITSPKSIDEPKPIDTSNLKPIRMANAGLNWNARRQILETEDREKAKLLKEKAKEIQQANDLNRISTEELEKEVLGDIVEKANNG